MFAQTYLDVNFDSGIPANFQLNNGGDSQSESWFGVNSYVESGQAKTLNGTPFLFCNGDPIGAGNNMDEYLETPSMNTSAANQVFLQFIQYYRDYNATPTDSGIIEVFDGSDWVKVLAQTANSGTWAQPKLMRINLTPYRNPAMKIRFHFMGEWPWWWAIDNLRVYVPQAKDIGPSLVVAPTTDCNLGNAVTLKIKIANYGTAIQSNFPVSYTVNGGDAVTQNFTANLTAGNSADFTFSTPVDITNSGVYKIKFWTGLVGDGSADNDSLSGFVITQFRSGFPKQEFTLYDGNNLTDVSPGWKESRGLKGEGLVSNWTKSGPLQQAFFGSVSAKLNLLGNTQKEWIVTPSIVPTAATGLIFKCAVTDWNSGQSDNMGSDDSLKIRISTNCGTTWRTLFFLNSSSGLNNQFKTFIIPLTQYSGQEIKIGFYATEGNVNNDEDYDIHLDDIELKTLPPKDLGVTAIVNPVSGCGLNNTQVKVTIRNFGSKTQRQFPVSLQMNNGAVLSETFTDSIISNQSKDYIFSIPSNIVSPGIYTFSSWTGLAGDVNSFNDSLKNYSIENTIAIANYPYSQNFENGDGGWKVGGAFPSWALGTPQKSIINSPAEGIKSWVTGGLGTGTYNSNEKSFVLGPCFNFSSLVNPIIEMKVWWHSEYSADGALLQYSKNNGLNWFNVGAFGDPNNWYNDNTAFAVSQLANPQHAWTGGTNADPNGSEGWLTARNFLKGLGGQPLVKLRVVFGSNFSGSGDGFGFDDIKIYESPLKDVELTSIVSPLLEGCGFTSSHPVQVKITNKGRQVLSNIPVRYQVNNQTLIQEVIAGPLDTNQTLTYTFNTPVNLSQTGLYNFKFWLAMDEDGISNNDTIKNYKIQIYDNAIDTVTFSGYNGLNLTLTNLGWKESRQYRPQGNLSAWTNCNIEQEAYFGTKTAKVFLFSNTTREWLISPQINCEATTKLGFKIARTAKDLTANAAMGIDDTLSVMVSTDCGLNWQRIYTFTKDSAISNVLKSYRISLSAFAGQKIQVGFYATDGPSIFSAQNYDLHLDNIYIIPSPAKDLALVSIIDPASSCGLVSNQIIKLKVFNNGSQPASGYSINYQINNLPVVTELVSQTLNPSGTADLTFASPANLSLPGDYLLKVWITFAGDLVTENNTLVSRYTKYSTPTQLVTFNGFNGLNISTAYLGWQEGRGATPQGKQSNWEALAIGSNTVAKVFISGASISEWLVSPPIKLGGAPALTFKAALRFPNTNVNGVFDTDDRVKVMVTTDCGAQWTPVFLMDDTLQIPLTAALQDYQVDLSAFENQEIRFAFLANDGTREDLISEFLLDDIRVLSSATFTDLSVLEFVGLGSVIGLGTENEVKVRLKNLGTVPITNALLKVKLNGNNYAAFVNQLIAPNSSLDISLGNFSATVVGPVTGRAIVKTNGDVEAMNDTLRALWEVVNVEETLSRNSRIEVFPNPASERLWIKTSEPFTQSSYVLIENVVGRQFPVEVMKVSDSEWVISTNHLPRGVYSLRIFSNDQIRIVRFVRI